MSKAEQIKARLQDANIRYWAGDNISEILQKGDKEELLKCFKFAVTMGNDNVQAENNITGYNIGLNIGTSAGQTCMYPHVHLIFRRDGDCEDPKGGVRGVIPNKQKY